MKPISRMLLGTLIVAVICATAATWIVSKIGAENIPKTLYTLCAVMALVNTAQALFLITICTLTGMWATHKIKTLRK